MKIKMELQDLFYILAKSEIIVDKDFLRKTKFCWVNDEVNMLVKMNEKMMDMGEGQIINKIFTSELNGENFIVIDNAEHLYIYAYETKKEMNEILRYGKVFEDKYKFVVVQRGKIVDGVKRTGTNVMKEPVILEK